MPRLNAQCRIMLALLVFSIAFVGRASSQQARPGRASQTQVIAVVMTIAQAQVSGDMKLLETLYAPDAIRVGPSNVEPLAGRATILKQVAAASQSRKPTYFYLRQPEALVAGPSSALVVANYESGDNVEGKIIENNGKVLYVLTLSKGKWLVGAEAVVPNLGTGSYGPFGTALQPLKSYGVLPSRSLASFPTASEVRTRFTNLTEQQIVNAVDQVNDAWSSGNVHRLEAVVNQQGAFSIGDFGPFYLAGSADLHQHFVDFYRTAKVNSIKIGMPSIKVFGNLGVAAFQFDTVLTIDGKETRSPGEAMYVFRMAPNNHWLMAGCSESMFVNREIGDPYQ